MRMFSSFVGKSEQMTTRNLRNMLQVLSMKNGGLCYDEWVCVRCYVLVRLCTPAHRGNQTKHAIGALDSWYMWLDLPITIGICLLIYMKDHFYIG